MLHFPKDWPKHLKQNQITGRTWWVRQKEKRKRGMTVFVNMGMTSPFEPRGVVYWEIWHFSKYKWDQIRAVSTQVSRFIWSSSSQYWRTSAYPRRNAELPITNYQRNNKNPWSSATLLADATYWKLVAAFTATFKISFSGRNQCFSPNSKWLNSWQQVHLHSLSKIPQLFIHHRTPFIHNSSSGHQGTAFYHSSSFWVSPLFSSKTTSLLFNLDRFICVFNSNHWKCCKTN